MRAWPGHDRTRTRRSCAVRMTRGGIFAADARTSRHRAPRVGAARVRSPSAARPRTCSCCASSSSSAAAGSPRASSTTRCAACQLIPGPASTQLAIYCAQRVAGLPGALAGGLGFILPGLLDDARDRRAGARRRAAGVDPRDRRGRRRRGGRRDRAGRRSCSGAARCAAGATAAASAYALAGRGDRGPRGPVRRARAGRAPGCSSWRGAAARWPRCTPGRSSSPRRRRCRASRGWR